MSEKKLPGKAELKACIESSRQVQGLSSSQARLGEGPPRKVREQEASRMKKIMGALGMDIDKLGPRSEQEVDAGTLALFNSLSSLVMPHLDEAAEAMKQLRDPPAE